MREGGCRRAACNVGLNRRTGARACRRGRPGAARRARRGRAREGPGWRARPACWCAGTRRAASPGCSAPCAAASPPAGCLRGGSDRGGTRLALLLSNELEDMRLQAHSSRVCSRWNRGTSAVHWTSLHEPRHSSGKASARTQRGLLQQPLLVPGHRGELHLQKHTAHML